MNKYHDPKLSLETLQTYQGYSLQVFTSGRIKLSFHISHTDRVEYYVERPKRFREAYAKQRQRSHLVYPEHFAIVDQLLNASPNTLIQRVHQKGDNNATADHVHVLTDISKNICHIIFDCIHHRWDLPQDVTRALHLRGGPKTGAASIFNEYMPSYDHDWEDVAFTQQDYQVGCRAPHKARVIGAKSHNDDFQF